MPRLFKTLPFGKICAFLNERRGQVAMTFGLVALPAVLVVGSAIDYSRAVQRRSDLQQASDATVLAIARSYLTSTSTCAGLFGPTQKYLSGVFNTTSPSQSTSTINRSCGGTNVAGPTGQATLQSITFQNNNAQMCISTTLAVPTVMMSIIDVTTMNVGARACSQTADTNEIAVVVDNSGSMTSSAGGQSKMDALKAAAKDLVTILIPSTSSTSISLVPFTALVKVGTDQSAAFLDKQGRSSIHWQNFHRPPGVSFLPTSKLDLFSQLRNATWGGCVEERPYPYMTTDAAPSTSTPDTLFVPFFAPDDPGDDTQNLYCYPKCSNPLNNAPSSNHYYSNSYLKDGGASDAGDYCPTDSKKTDSLYYQWDMSTAQQSDGLQPTVTPGAGATMLCKYKNASVLNSGSSGSSVGPNSGCMTAQITPLNTRAAVLTDAIDDLVASGSTNLLSGFMWGWRSISPIVNPFPVASPSTSGPQNPKPYTSPTNHKFIVFMTDGFNSYGASWNSGGRTYYTNDYTPNYSTYEGLGYFINGRLAHYASGCSAGTSASAVTQDNYRCAMDKATLEACNNARRAGVVVYTISFSTRNDPIDAAGLALMRSCAYDPSHYYAATDSATIKTAFQQIAQSILSLRLSQ